MKNSADSVDAIVQLAEEMRELAEQGIAESEPVVKGIISSRSEEVGQIERTLDQLLDFCSVPRGVELFRSLCRYYWHLDREGAAFYVLRYREMWDDDGWRASESAEPSERL